MGADVTPDVGMPVVPAVSSVSKAPAVAAAAAASILPRRSGWLAMMEVFRLVTWNID